MADPTLEQRTLETKAFGALEVKNAARGEVEAVVATLGVVDRDGDVIMHGAFPPGGAKVKLSGYAHDVVLEGKAPAGKGIITEENGQAIFRGKFFLSTERGREAFHTTEELGPDGTWSFGFPKDVKTGELTDAWRAKGARRVITGLVPIEASPVFIPAGIGTGTLSVKQADADRAELLAIVARVRAWGQQSAAEELEAPARPATAWEEGRAARPGLEDLRRNRVKSYAIPAWMDDAATWGRRFVVRKVFGHLPHPSGQRDGPTVKWFAGEPARAIAGLTYTLEPGTIWLAATMKSWEAVVNAAAHETVHSFHADHGPELYHDHELPTLVGNLAAWCWKGERDVFVKWGPLPSDWTPEGEQLRHRSERAVVLNFDGGDYQTYVNMGQTDRPRWLRMAV